MTLAGGQGNLIVFDGFLLFLRFKGVIVSGFVLYEWPFSMEVDQDQDRCESRKQDKY